MKNIVECVPNISEGRDRGVIDALADVVRGVDDVVLLDRHVDPDHHRTVFTIGGSPEAMLEAAYQLVCLAAQLIDLSEHRGVHPRVGAVDVIPFIPLQGVTMDDCITMAQQLGKRIGSELEMPVFLYAEASSRMPWRQLELIRRGGRKGLSKRIASDLNWRPDFGPSKLHPTAGAVAVGARNFLIAYNVVLQTNDLEIAQAIAKTIRASGGGFPAIKAMGVALKTRGLTQVSMNLTNYRQTSLNDVYCAIQQHTQQYGIDIEESELVGLAPQAAILPEWIAPLKFKRWNPDQILETRLAQTGLV